MKILELRAENLKKITVVEIKPDDNLVQITGKNGQGKTSVLDAIWWALGGDRVVQAMPIKQGAKRGKVTIDLGDYTVVKTFTAKDDGEHTTTLAVTTKDGAKYGSPQKLLNSVLGQFTFDPLAFMRMAPAEQVASLKALVSDYDFATADKENEQDFNARTEIKRKLKETQAALAQITLPDPLPEPVDIAATVEAMRKAEETNRQIADDKIRWSHGRNAIGNVDKDISEATAKITALQDAIEAWKVKRAELDRDYPENAIHGEGIDLEPFRVKIAGAQEINAIVAKGKEHETLIATAASLNVRADTLTKAIEARKKLAAEAIAKAPIPVDGLTIDANGVLLDGIPFSQASDAQQLKTSIGLAMAMNPKLRVIRVRDGSLLDEDALATLAEMAKANDYQIWIEIVDGSGEVGFVMEDGRIKGQVVEEPAAEPEPEPESASGTFSEPGETVARPKDGMSAMERVAMARKAREAKAAGADLFSADGSDPSAQ